MKNVVSTLCLAFLLFSSPCLAGDYLVRSADIADFDRIIELCNVRVASIARTQGLRCVSLQYEFMEYLQHRVGRSTLFRDFSVYVEKDSSEVVGYSFSEGRFQFSAFESSITLNQLVLDPSHAQVAARFAKTVLLDLLKDRAVKEVTFRVLTRGRLEVFRGNNCFEISPKEDIAGPTLVRCDWTQGGPRL